MKSSEEIGFWDISKILVLIPISKSSWWAGVKSGKYPKAIKHGGRTFWSAQSILELLESIERGE